MKGKTEIKRKVSILLTATLCTGMLPAGSISAWGGGGIYEGVTRRSSTASSSNAGSSHSGSGSSHGSSGSSYGNRATSSNASSGSGSGGGPGSSTGGSTDYASASNAALMNQEGEYEIIEVDLSGGLKKGKDYDGVSVLEDMNKKSGSATIEGESYTYCVSGTNNPKADGNNMDSSNLVPDSGAAVKFEPKADGEIAFDVQLGTNKTWQFVEVDENGSARLVEQKKNEGGSGLYTRFTNLVREGCTYYAYAAGSKITIYGITIAYGGSLDTPNIYPELEKKYDSSYGEQYVTELMVPTLAYDDTSIVIVWQKPEGYADIADYHVYINDELQKDTARENYQVYADWSAVYADAFYKEYEDAARVDVHSYTATGLEPDTEYTFKVIPIDEYGNELVDDGVELTQSTTETPEIFDIRDYGAVPVEEGYVTYDAEKNALIESNTRAIQAAIDDCSEGGKVVIPEGIWMTGALWLKSNMTLELQDGSTLWASPNSDHFDIGFLMYPFYTDTRCWGVLNATSTDESQSLENIRITGNGTVYGNGWKYGSKDSINGDGYSRYTYEGHAQPDEKGYELPRWVAGSNTKVYSYGILAADSAKKYLANVTDESGSKKYSGLTESDYKNPSTMSSKVDKTDLTNAYATRSSLIMMRNVDGVYISGIKVENPANHSVNILDSRNIAANNVKVFSYDCNNGDGLGFGCSQNVICFNNFLDTGDDTIGFGASVGKGAQDSEIQSNSNIWIFGNYVHEGHGGIIACGSHTAQGVFNMLAEDNIANESDMPFRFKSAPANGGFASNVLIRDSAIANCDQAFVFTTSYSDPNSASSSEGADVPAEFYDIDVYNVTAETISANTICVYADVDPVDEPQKPWHTHHDLYFQDVTFNDVGTNGSYKNYGGWGTLTGCEDSIFYDVMVNSYSSKAKQQVEWGNIKYSSNNLFIYSDQNEADERLTTLMNDQMEGPGWAEANVTAETGVKENGSHKSAYADISWDKAEDNAFRLSYQVDVYLGDTKIDTKAGISGTSCHFDGLSTGTEYTFRVYACDDSGNKTAAPDLTVTTEGETDSAPIASMSDAKVSLDNAFYRHCQGTWNSAKVKDDRIRGYHIYANGSLLKTVYNYQIKNGNTVDTVSLQIGRLEPGMENVIEIVAFTDAGIEYHYPEASIQTLENYDFKAPQWSGGALDAVVNEDGSITLSWPEADDDTQVRAYRVYVDGEGVYRNANDYFKPVNGDYTTTETTYTIRGLDLSVSHTFKVEAGDTWWKAAQTMGSYEQMADYHWSLTGPEYTYTPAGVDKTALSALISTAEGMKEDDYTAESWAAFAEALAAAKTTAADKDASQEAVDAAADALQKAMDALAEAEKPDEEEEIDKTELNRLILQARSKHEDDYTKDSWKVFEDALDAAKEVYGDENATQAEIDAAAAALEKAMNRLVFIDDEDEVNTDELNQLIEEAASLDETEYTAESWAALAEALEKALAIAEDPDAEQKDVNEAADALIEALENLVKKDTSDKPAEDEPEDTPSEDTPSEDTPSEDTPSGSGSSGSGSSGGGREKTDLTHTLPTTYANLSGFWKQDAAGWRYAKTSGGYAQSEWGMINNKWYYFGSDGYAENGWLLVNGAWYYLDQVNCDMKSGWLQETQNGYWYYLDPATGAMRTGWVQVNGKWYYLNPAAPTADGDLPFGAMYANTVTPDGYHVGVDGAWIQ